MPKTKGDKKSVQLRHAPLSTEIEKPVGKLRAPRHRPKASGGAGDDADYDDEEGDGGGVDDDDEGNAMDVAALPRNLGERIHEQAREQRLDEARGAAVSSSSTSQRAHAGAQKAVARDVDSDEYEDDVEEEDDDGETDGLIEFDGEYVGGVDLSEAEEAVVQKFLQADRSETRTLADIIMEKIREKEEGGGGGPGGGVEEGDEQEQGTSLPPKVVEVYSAVGKMLAHYKAGKLPKALKMLPHLKNWEDVLWLTRPDEWSPAATFACTRIFASNLNEKMAQRFFNMVLLEKCRDDIRGNDKLNYHLYMALKKALFKPAAFYKGLLLPLAQSNTCTLREATIIGSVLAKVSIPGNHSAAALLRMAEMPYSGSTSLFIRVLINKKYSLPRRVIEALVAHFYSFEKETRGLPVIWHQALLVFSQRYKLELDEGQKERLKLLCRAQQHPVITGEVRRELFYISSGESSSGGGAMSY